MYKGLLLLNLLVMHIVSYKNIKARFVNWNSNIGEKKMDEVSQEHNLGAGGCLCSFQVLQSTATNGKNMFPFFSVEERTYN